MSPHEMGITGRLCIWRRLGTKGSLTNRMMRLLIRHGADVTAQDDAHSTPLHLASSKGSVETVEMLIQHGADVNAQNGDQSTPLHLAASSRLAVEGNVVRLLLKHGANVDAKDGEGRTPLQVASSEGHYWIAKLLSDHHART
ncbi:ankyrin repeat-containing domain protein [Lactarius akahatsu]|uniref:Ankyrin repeat-containing domain protein n=1 Tax=Lactarius akahatsu TaxID=416441 RepID=A0AAD4LA94_9AGAM|nr:ankyrin repeat-containing domain protein [Lactarius akahatsu]